MNMVRLGKTEIQVKMGLEPSLSRELPRQKQCICFKRLFIMVSIILILQGLILTVRKNWGQRFLM